jgi:ABC-type glycerol-3-phosphate transport system substrate-binding protein
MKPTLKLSLILSLAALLAACSPSAPLGTSPSAPTLAVRSAPAPSQPAAAASASLDPNLPITEAGVPRVTVEKAKAALDAGEAIIVDVRTAEAYAAEHVAGALLVPLGDIVQDASGVPLDKSKWIITYCT